MEALHAKPSFRLLTDASTEDERFTKIVLRVGGPFQKAVEQAGAAFMKRQLAASGKTAGPAKISKGPADDSDSLIKDVDAASLAKVDPDSYYELLGLGELNVNATDEQVRRAYRRVVLKLHPDKAQQAAGGSGTPTPTTPKSDDKTDPLFLAVQKAYDCLSNPEKRKAYDSRYEFDDDIPSGQEKGDFFAVYGPVFERNGRFSVHTPVPKLGTAATPIDSVESFYAFWFGFESWREFTGGEHDPNDAEYREEKRWMERQNKKETAKLKRAEVDRVSTLVQRAYARDPRVLAKKAADEAAKRAAHEARQAAKRAVEEQAARREAELKAMATAEEESRKVETGIRKAAREREKRAVKAAGRALKEAVAAGGAEGLTEAELEWWLGRTDGPSVLAMHATVFGVAVSIESKGSSGEASPVPGGMASLAQRIRDDRAKATPATPIADGPSTPQEEAPPTPIVIGRKEVPDWSPAELSSLAKALARYPGGARNRWKMVADAINGLGLPHSRTPEECIAKAQRIGEEDKKKVNASAFSMSQDAVRHRTEDKLGPVKTDGLLPAVAPADREKMEKDKTDKAETPTAAATPTATPTPAKEGEAEGGVWSPEQQAALEAALRKFPASMDKNERWKAVAEAVPGKTKKDCIARFKEVREKLMAGKS